MDNKEEDEDEWEYEYSTTEREVYYLTLDLSVRDFLERRTDDIIHNTRGGYRVWYNPLFNAPEPRTTNPDLIDDAKDADDGEPPEREDAELENIGIPQLPAQNETPIDPLLQQPVEADPVTTVMGDSNMIEEIQILDLHSKEPIVSYRNHVFRGSWAENIGTEMIFTPHDDEAHLPALRHLSQNIDLLAASASRINFKEITLVPKEEAGMPEMEPTKDSYNKEEEIPERYKHNGGIYVHIGGDKTGQRQPQAHFLEDLIALKRKRGETDEVTIQPLETTQNKLLVDDAEEERRRKKVQSDYARNLKWRARNKGSMVEDPPAQATETNYVAREKKNSRDPVRKRGGRRGFGLRPRTRRAALVRRQTRDEEAPQSRVAGDATSTPTPARWDDLRNDSQPG